ncbi:MAG: site-specific integrase [Polyangiaceae bacterium]|nr:site-specific integrase [Polyangiaceae bacterium]
MSQSTAVRATRQTATLTGRQTVSSKKNQSANQKGPKPGTLVLIKSGSLEETQTATLASTKTQGTSDFESDCQVVDQDLKKKRANGAGSVSALGDGRFQVRMVIAGERRSLGVYPTYEEADEVRRATLMELSKVGAPPVGGVTLRMFGERFLNSRELSGDFQDSKKLRSVWRNNMEGTPIIDIPMRALADQPKLVVEWYEVLRKRPVKDGTRRISRGTVVKAVALLRMLFAAAQAPTAGLVSSNPVAHIKIAREKRTEEPWTYLSAEEIERIRTNELIPAADRWMILFAIGTGLRLGEMMNLELRDIRVDGDRPEVTVRFGSKGRAPKNGKIRYVPLFGIGLLAAQEWLKLLPSYAPRNPSKLVFPNQGGARRDRGKHLHHRTKRAGKRSWVNRFKRHLRTLGITRRVRWHDLRHTCASMLISGCWGRMWSMQETQGMLGHRSPASTTRYAHLAEGTLQIAARATVANVQHLVKKEGSATISSEQTSLSVNDPSVGYPLATKNVMTVPQLLELIDEKEANDVNGPTDLRQGRAPAAAHCVGSRNTRHAMLRSDPCGGGGASLLHWERLEHPADISRLSQVTNLLILLTIQTNWCSSEFLCLECTENR